MALIITNIYIAEALAASVVDERERGRYAIFSLHLSPTSDNNLRIFLRNVFLFN